MKTLIYILSISIVVTIYSCGEEADPVIGEVQEEVFEEGFSVESESKTGITEEMVEAQPILFISESSSLIPSEMEAKLGGAFGEILALMSVAQVEMTVPPMSITTMFSIEEMKTEFDVAIVAELPEGVEVAGRVQKGETYAGKALKAVNVGPYTHLKTTYNKIVAYMKANGYENNGNSWIVYVDDPATVAADKVRTSVYIPVK